MVVVADGRRKPQAARARSHDRPRPSCAADAGYPEAIQVARARGVKVPMFPKS
jgi:hypothetical protein